MSTFVHPSLADVPLETVLHALADPARLRIVQRLDRCEGEDGLTCSEGACPDLPRATMSNHYTVMRNAGLIESRKVGVTVRSRLRRADLDKRFPGLIESVLDSAPAL